MIRGGGARTHEVALLHALAAFRRLRSFSLQLGESAMDLHMLAGILLRAPQLTEVQLDIPFRAEAGVTALFPVLLRCHRVHLRVSMTDVEEEVLGRLARMCATSPPAWTQLRLSLKHNMVTDAGVAHLVAIADGCPQLEDLHLNLSYVPMGMAGLRQLVELPAVARRLRRCVLKLDSDLPHPERLDTGLHVDARHLEALRLSMAFTVVVGFDRLQLGPRLHRLELDLEGCRFGGRGAVAALAAALAGAAPTLRTLVLRMVAMQLTDAQLVPLLQHGVGALHRLERAVLNIGGNPITDAAVDAVVAHLPASVRHLSLDVGDARGVHRLDLASRTLLEGLHLCASATTVVALGLPDNLVQLGLDLDDAHLLLPDGLRLPHSRLPCVRRKQTKK